MRIRLCAVSTLLLTALAAVQARAEEPPEKPRPLRIATFDLGRIVRESVRVTKGKARVEREFAAEKQEYATLKDELLRLGEQIRHSMYRRESPEHREQVTRFQARERVVVEKGADLRRRISEAKSRLLADMYADLRGVLREIVEKDGIDLVFQLHHPSPDPDRPAIELVRELNALDLFHAHPRFDVTDRILEALNESEEEGE